MMRKEAKIGVLLVFAVFLWYLLAQYSSVYIYYDDYGYLSLSYGYRVQGVTGLGYTPAQMLEFVQGHYASGSSGRLLYMLIFLVVSYYTKVLLLVLYKFFHFLLDNRSKFHLILSLV